MSVKCTTSNEREATKSYRKNFTFLLLLLCVSMMLFHSSLTFYVSDHSNLMFYIWIHSNLTFYVSDQEVFDVEFIHVI